METMETGGHDILIHPRDSVAPAESRKTPAEDDSDTDEGLGGLKGGKSQESRAKTRRARRKAYKPYYQLSEGERGVREERERLRVAKLKERMWAKGRMLAPYNTTQFLMSDADASQTDFYFSSTHDTKDFMSNEFRKDYEVHNLNRLEKMSKEMLLNEYLMLERKNERLEEKLRSIKEREEVAAKKITDSEYAERASKLQSELEKLKAENERLAKENLQMKAKLSGDNESESEESSDDDDKSSGSATSSTSEDLESLIEDKPRKGSQELPSSSSDDPGYESNQSKSDVK